MRRRLPHAPSAASCAVVYLTRRRPPHAPSAAPCTVGRLMRRRPPHALSAPGCPMRVMLNLQEQSSARLSTAADLTTFAIADIPCLRILEVGTLPKGRGHVMRFFRSPVLEEIRISSHYPTDVEEGLEALLDAEPALGEKLQRLHAPPVSERLLARFKNIHFVARPKRAVSWEA
ncbi:hypothetical protein BD626DRAFT_636146 [Schizophyllum amplum]|uniref:Uncharacterized protein n=1 Tax=Schizophyllum amplum TaxID=97359 RepID=A0A550BTS3_9AGAR|nr:hypothetical protein BD626DRAFT_636146 [Auriculariopsis ampla]